MTGIITDTGGLQYPSTTADTFEYLCRVTKKRCRYTRYL